MVGIIVCSLISMPCATVSQSIDHSWLSEILGKSQRDAVGIMEQHGFKLSHPWSHVWDSRPDIWRGGGGIGEWQFSSPDFSPNHHITILFQGEPLFGVVVRVASTNGAKDVPTQLALEQLRLYVDLPDSIKPGQVFSMKGSSEAVGQLDRLRPTVNVIGKPFAFTPGNPKPCSVSLPSMLAAAKSSPTELPAVLGTPEVFYVQPPIHDAKGNELKAARVSYEFAATAPAMRVLVDFQSDGGHAKLQTLSVTFDGSKVTDVGSLSKTMTGSPNKMKGRRFAGGKPEYEILGLPYKATAGFYGDKSSFSLRVTEVGK